MLEHEPLRALQLGPGLDAELLDERLARAGVLRERLGLAPVAVQREHQLRAQTLAQRLGRDEGLQLRHELGVPSECEVGVDPLLERAQAQLLEARRVELRRAAPERERVTQSRRRDCRLGAACGRDQVVEAGEIDLLARDGGRVAGRAALDQVGAERAAQLRDIDLQRVLRRLGRLVAPQLVDQPLGGDGLARAEQQRGEERARLRAGDREQAVAVGDLERAEQAELHPPFVPPSALLQKTFSASRDSHGVKLVIRRRKS